MERFSKLKRGKYKRNKHKATPQNIKFSFTLDSMPDWPLLASFWSKLNLSFLKPFEKDFIFYF
jgi:hypothetical protein